MSDRIFLDSNVLAYCDDPREPAKQRRAVEVLADLAGADRAVLSTQVLKEYFVTATRKLHIPAEAARARVAVLARLDVVIIRPELILGAIDLHRLHGISFWDALIVRSAAVAGCGRIYTEDLNHGQVIDGVRIENPFVPLAGGAGERGAAYRAGKRKTPRRSAAAARR